MTKENKKLIRIVLMLYTLTSIVSTCLAQDTNGIKFETDLSFIQIKEKANDQKKYIFVDNYTTWCIPCKKMEAEIFPLKEVGDFFNKHFINYKVQIDSTKDDSYIIKNAYKDAKSIAETYQINIFPTYLVLNPEGVLIHRFTGGSSSPKEFIAKVQKALDPVTQGNNLVAEFAKGRRDSSFLKLMIEYGTTSDRKNRALYVQCFLKTQKTLLTAQNIRYILQSVASSKDIGYDILINHPKEVIVVAGEQWRNYVINDVIFNDHILPVLRKDGKKEILPGHGMFVYNGEINKNINWTALKDSLESNFKDRSIRLFVNAKTSYYSWTNDWENLNKTLLAYSLQNEHFEEDVLAEWLEHFVSFAPKKHLPEALDWSAKIVTSKNPIVIKNRSLLLYKIGKKQKAIKMMQQYHNMLPKTNLETTTLITKMKKGEKIN